MFHLALLASEDEWEQRLRRLRVTSPSKAPFTSAAAVRPSSPRTPPVMSPRNATVSRPALATLQLGSTAQRPASPNRVSLTGPSLNLTATAPSAAAQVWNPFDATRSAGVVPAPAQQQSASPPGSPRFVPAFAPATASASPQAAATVVRPASPRPAAQQPVPTFLRSELRDRRTHGGSPPLAPMAGWRSPRSPLPERDDDFHRSPRGVRSGRVARFADADSPRTRSRAPAADNASRSPRHHADASPRSPRSPVQHKRSFTQAAEGGSGIAPPGSSILHQAPLASAAAASLSMSYTAPLASAYSWPSQPLLDPAAATALPPFYFTVRIVRAVSLPAQRNAGASGALSSEPSCFLRYRLLLPALSALAGSSTPTAAASAVAVLQPVHQGRTALVPESSSPVFNHVDTAPLPEHLFDHKPPVHTRADSPSLAAKKRRSDSALDGAPASPDDGKYGDGSAGWHVPARWSSSSSGRARPSPTWVLAIARAQLMVEAVAVTTSARSSSAAGAGRDGPHSPKRFAPSTGAEPVGGWVDHTALGSACVDLAPLGTRISTASIIVSSYQFEFAVALKMGVLLPDCDG